MTQVQLPPVDDDPTVEPLEAFTQEDITFLLETKERFARTIAEVEEGLGELSQKPEIEL